MIRLAFFGNSLVRTKNPQSTAPVTVFTDLLIQHYGAGLTVTHWGRPGVSSMLEVRDMILDQPVNYDLAVVLHLWHSEITESEFQKAQLDVIKHFEQSRRPVLHCLDPQAPNVTVESPDQDWNMLAMTRLTAKTRNYVDLEVSVNNIDQVGNWRLAKIVESFIERHRGARC